MAKAIMMLAPGFEEIEALSIVDVLRRGGVRVVMAAVAPSIDVLGAHGICVKADAMLEDVAEETFDALILPGGGEGTANLKDSDLVIECLRRQKEEGRLICAICAAPTILSYAGVLDPEQHVTCYPTCVMELDRKCAGVPVVVDDNVITGQAPGSAMLFALVVLKVLTNEALAHRVAREMVTDVLDM